MQQCAGGALVNRTDSLLLRALMPVVRTREPLNASPL